MKKPDSKREPVFSEGLFPVLGFGTLFLFYYAIAGFVGFLWLYAVWFLLKQDRFLEAAAALIIPPLGAVYGAMRFFGFL
jgi:hypothetical protein